MPTPFRLLDLPPELITHVLTYVPPPGLARLACTCRTLKDLAYDDVLWQRIVVALDIPGVAPETKRTSHGGLSHRRGQLLNEFGKNNDSVDGDDFLDRSDSVTDKSAAATVAQPHGHSPFGTWRELYAAHCPYWFLPRYRIWVGDRLTGRQDMIGQVVVARYDYRMGTIEVYRMQAENSQHNSFLQWEYDPNVIIHLFNPRVSLFTDDPVVRLEPGSYLPGGRLQQEVPFYGGAMRHAMNRRSRLMLTRALPEEAQSQGTQVWPPRIIPSAERVRSASGNMFRDVGHKPTNHNEVCQTAFRTRTWCDFLGLNVISLSSLGGATMGEEVTTFSTLPPECYTPTKEKPYQGIWVGDYSGHGFEFLLLTQKTPDESRDIPPIKDMAETGRDHRLFLNDLRLLRPSRATATQELPPRGPDPPGCSGRLEAI